MLGRGGNPKPRSDVDDNDSGGIGGNVRGVNPCESVVVLKMPPGPNMSPSFCEFMRRGVCDAP